MEAYQRRIMEQDCVNSCPLCSLLQMSSHLGLYAHLPQLYLLKKTGVTQVSFLQPFWQHLYWTHTSSSPGIGPDRWWVRERASVSGAQTLIFWVEKRVRESSEGKQRQTYLQSMITPHPSSGFTNRRAVCLSVLQGTSEEHGNHLLLPALPQWWWDHRTLVWAPALCFPNFVPEDLNLPESCVLRYQMRSVLHTSCGCHGSNGGNRHVFLLPEKSKAFVVLIITVMSSYTR